jgi:hypothetical protein
MPPSEQGITRDTVFDLAYWRWGLDQVQCWRERLGLAQEPSWDPVRRRLAPLPAVDGVFVHSAEWKDTYSKRAWEHPDLVGALGMLPPVEGVEPSTDRGAIYLHMLAAEAFREALDSIQAVSDVTSELGRTRRDIVCFR